MKAFAIAALAAAALGPAHTAGAADLTIRIQGLRSAEGVVRVAVCPRESFTKPSCPHLAAAAAREGQVVLRDVPEGVYAVQAFHDEDGDGDLDRKGLRPLEGLGFSRDAPMRMGPPRFRDAAIRIVGDGTLTVSMRYYQ
jgi:uncharacterized protein (DUF2141 family)